MNHVVDLVVRKVYRVDHKSSIQREDDDSSDDARYSTYEPSATFDNKLYTTVENVFSHRVINIHFGSLQFGHLYLLQIMSLTRLLNGRSLLQH